MLLVVGEVVVISFLGAGAGVGLSYAAMQVIQRLPSLIGVLHADYTAGVFGRAFIVATGIGLFGAFYPALRAAFLRPLVALRRE